MITRTKAPQLPLFPITNLFRIAIAPLHRYLAISIGIYQHVECTFAVELGQEGDGRGDLSEDRLDLGLDFCFGLLGGWCGGGCAGVVNLVLE